MLRIDATDARILIELVRSPRMTVSEIAEKVRIARNTAQHRLERLHDSGVLGSQDRSVDLRRLGFDVHAVVSIEVRHTEIEQTVAALAKNPNVIEVEEVAGSSGDLLVRIAALSTDDLQRVVHSLLRTPGVTRTATSVVLASRVPYRVVPLLAATERG